VTKLARVLLIVKFFKTSLIFASKEAHVLYLEVTPLRQVLTLLAIIRSGLSGDKHSGLFGLCDIETATK
jgi:hypothetical protein